MSNGKAKLIIGEMNQGRVGERTFPPGRTQLIVV